MKKLAMLTIVALAALGLTGCVQMYSDTIIEKDGSGTASLTLSLSPTGAELIKEMKELEMDQDQNMEMPLFEDINEDDLVKAAKGHGVKIKKFEKSTVEGAEKIDILMEFEDLEGLSYVMGSSMGGEAGTGYGIFETADGNFILKAAHYDFPADETEGVEVIETAPEAEAQSKESSDTPAMTEEEKAQKQMALMGKLMGAMAELDIKFTITVPGEIIESNAPTVEGNTSIWAVNASNMMSQQGTDMEPVITFSSNGLKIKPLKE